MEMCDRFYCKRTGQYGRINLVDTIFDRRFERRIVVGSDKKNKVNKIKEFFGFGKKDEDREDIDASRISDIVKENAGIDRLDDIAPAESDWKPFVDYLDGEDLSYDDSEAEFDEEDETLSDKEDKETDNKIDEEEDTAEQYAQHREDSGSICTGEAFDNGSGQQAEEGSEEAEGDGLFVDSGDAGDGGSAEEGGGGDEGSEGEPEDGDEGSEGEPEDGGGSGAEAPEDREAGEAGEDEEDEETVSLAVEPEFDDEDTFEPEGEFDITEADGLSWNRKKLRIEAEKSGERVVVDDGLMTAITSGYIDRKKYIERKKAELSEKAEDSDDDSEFLSLISSAASRPRTAGQAGPEIPELPDEEDDSTSVRISERAIRAILDQDRDPEDDFFGDIDEPENGADDGTESERAGGETSQSAENAGAGQEDIDAGDVLVDYDDIFQDDPGVTKKKNKKRKIKSVLKEIFKNLLIFIIVFVVFIFAYLTFTVYCSRKNHVYGTSMEPTLHQGDEVRSSLLPYVFGKPKVGDIVIIDTERIGTGFNFFQRIGDVLKNNESISKMFFNGDEADILWIKRVVAVGGDTVEFIDGKFYRNGELVEEDYINDQTVVTYPNGEKIVVPDGYVYVMGDNRNVSQDSRSIGVVPIYALTGKKV